MSFPATQPPALNSPSVVWRNCDRLAGLLAGRLFIVIRGLPVGANKAAVSRFTWLSADCGPPFRDTLNDHRGHFVNLSPFLHSLARSFGSVNSECSDGAFADEKKAFAGEKIV